MSSQALERQSQPFYQIWFSVLTKPKADNYRRILETNGCSVLHAYMWLIACLLLFGTFYFFARNLLDLSIAQIISGVLTIAIYFSVQVFATHLGSRVLGGFGTYSELVYLAAAYYVPLLALGSLIELVLIVFSIDLTFSLSDPLYLFMAVLSVVAVKAVHHFKTGKAIVSAIIIPTIVMFLFRFVIPLLLFPDMF